MARGDRHDASSSGASTRAPASDAQLDLEDLAIERGGEIPIGVQLAWALRARIGDGRLAPGRRLPGLRELAEMLGINANTARAVYQRLEQEGLIDSRQGTGTFVASIAQEPSAVGQIAADAARQARKTGVDPREVAAALYVTAEPPLEGAEQAGERRRELRTQIAALEQALSEMQASHPGLIPTPAKPLRNAGPRLLSVEELQRVRSELVRRLASAEPPAQTKTQSPQLDKASARKRESPSRAVNRAEEAKQAKPLAERKSTRPRPPRTRPSTA
jgi:DNA-binding transcriptional regulator YhcF (GntR family)